MRGLQPPDVSSRRQSDRGNRLLTGFRGLRQSNEDGHHTYSRPSIQRKWRGALCDWRERQLDEFDAGVRSKPFFPPLSRCARVLIVVSQNRSGRATFEAFTDAVGHHHTRQRHAKPRVHVYNSAPAGGVAVQTAGVTHASRLPIYATKTSMSVWQATTSGPGETKYQ